MSTYQLIEYIVDGYVTQGYVKRTHLLGVDLSAQDVTVTVAARNGPGNIDAYLYANHSTVHVTAGLKSRGLETDLVCSDAVVEAVVKRTIFDVGTANGDWISSQPSKVVGTGVRIANISANLKAQDSKVSGLTEKGSNGTGTLISQDSKVSGFVSMAGTGTIKASDSVVVASTKITRKPIVAAVQAQDSVVVATTKRILPNIDIELESQASEVTGVSERIIVAGEEGLSFNVIDLDDITGPHGVGTIYNMIATSSGEFIGTQGGQNKLPQIFRSTDDGETWATSRPTGIADNSNDLAFVLALAQVSTNSFVLVGGANRAPDGVTIIGARLFVTTDNFSTMSSIDLDTILADVHKGNANQQSFADALQLASVAVGGGKVVVTGNFGIVLVASTSDLTSWTLVDTPQWSSPALPLNSGIKMYVANGGGSFVVSTQGFRTAYSSNGSTWTVGAEKSRKSNPFGIVYGDDHFLIVGSEGTICKTANGANVDVLLEEDALASVKLRDADYNAERKTWAVGGTGGSILVGKNGGTAWSYQNTSDPEQNGIKGIAFNGTNWVIAGDTAYLAYADESSFLAAVALYSGQSRVEIEDSISRDPIDATLQAQDAEVVGSAKRLSYPAPITLESSNSTVVGIAVRNSVGSGVLQSGASQVEGTLDRKLEPISAALQSGQSEVVGTTKRTVIGSGALKCSDADLVGTLQGIKVAEGILVASDFSLSGDADRGIDDQGGSSVEAQDAQVVAVVIRTVNSLTAALSTHYSSVNGVGARQPTLTSDLQSGDSEIVGAGYRTSVGNGVLVSGDANVEGRGAYAPLVADIELKVSDATVVGTVTRTVNLIDGIGTGINITYKRPEKRAANGIETGTLLYADYASDLFSIVIFGFSGISGSRLLKTGHAYTIDSSTGVVSIDTNDTYFIWKQVSGYELVPFYIGDVFVGRRRQVRDYEECVAILYDTDTDKWVHISTGTDLEDWGTGFTYNGTSTPVSIYTEEHTETGRTTSPSLSTGEAERLLNNDGLGQAVESGDSKVVGLVEGITRLPIVATLESGPSAIEGEGDLEKLADAALKSQDASVTGVGERLLNNDGLGQAVESGDASVAAIANIGRAPHVIVLKSGDSIVVGSTARVVRSVGTSSFKPTDNNLVVGLAERSSDAFGVLVSGQSTVVGVAERAVDDGETTHALKSANSLVVGLGERAIVTSVAIQAQDSHVDAIDVDRKVISISADLKAGDSTIDASVQLDFKTRIALKASDSKVVAVISRTYGGVDIALHSGNFTIHASNVEYSDDFIQIKRAVDVALKASDAAVSGVTEVSSNLLDGTGLKASDSTIVCSAERIIHPAVEIKANPSNVIATGVAERQIDGDDAALASSDATIVGVAERGIWHYGNGQQLAHGDSIVTGRAEREIGELAAVVSGPSSVTGEGDRTIDDEDRTHALKASDATVTGFGNLGFESQAVELKSGDATVVGFVVITSNLLSSADLIASDVVVAGIGDRVVDGDPGQTLEQSDSIVVGIGARISNASGALLCSDSLVDADANTGRNDLSADVQSTDSIVVGVGARGSNIESSNDLQAQDAQVTGLAERTIVRVPDETESALSPSNASNKVSYSGNKLVISNFTTTDAKFNGTYELLPEHGFVVDSQSDGDYTVAVDDEYNLYHRKVSSSLWYIVIYSEASSGNGHFTDRWYVTETDYDPKTLYNAVNSGYGTLTDAQDNETELTTLSVQRDRLTGGFLPLSVQESTVNGVVEIGHNVLSSAALKAGDATVTAVVERTSNAINAALKAGDAKVVGLAFGIEDLYIDLVAGDSKVVGFGNRAVDQDGATAELKSGDATVTAEVERTVNNIGTVRIKSSDVLVIGFAERNIDDNGSIHALTVSDSIVTGVGERTIVSSGTLVTSESVIVGDAEREIRSAVEIVAQDSLVTGLAERTITGSGILETTDCQVVGAADREIEDGGTTNALVASDSVVRGVAERVLNNHGLGQQLTTTDSIVVGEGIVARKPIRADLVTTESLVIGAGKVSRLPIEASLECTDSIVTAVTEISSNLLSSANLKASDAVVVCNAERVIEQNNQTAALLASESVVVGVAERALNNDGLGQSVESGESTVVGIAERTINGAGDVIVSDSIIVGRAERTIEEHPDDQSFNMKASDSKVTSTTQLIRKASGALKCSDSRTRGFAFGIEDIYEELVTTDSIVVGAGFRTSKTHTDETDLVSSDAAVVGRAIRTIETNEIEQNLTTGVSRVTGIVERIIRKPALGKQRLYSGPSSVVGLSERVVNLIEGISGGASETYYGPADADSNVDYNGQNLVLSGQLYSPLNGTYVYTGVDKYVVGATWTTNTDYRVWEKDNGDGTYNVVAYHTTFGDWSIWLDQGNSILSSPSSATGVSYELASNSDTIVISSGSTTDSLVTGIAERKIDDNVTTHAFKPTEFNLVVGVAERIIEQNELNAAFRPNIEHIVTGLAERVIEDAGVSHALTVTDSKVVGVAERILNAGDLEFKPTDFNIVVGVAERIINNDGLGQQLVTTESVVTGLAERVIEEHPDDQGDDPVSGDSKVTGLAERIVEEHPDDFVNALVNTDSIVTGLALRNITLVPGFNHIQSTDSKVVGLAERTVEDNGEIHALKPTEFNNVTGLAERVVEDNGVEHALTVSDSLVVGAAEREIRTSVTITVTDSIVTGEGERLVDNDGLGQQLFSTDSKVVGVAERTIDGTGIGGTSFFPANGSNINRAGNSIILSGLDEDENGTYDLVAGVEFIVDYDSTPTYEAGPGYTVWQKEVGSQYNIIVHAVMESGNTFWLLLTESFDDAADITAGDAIGGFPSTLTNSTTTVTRCTTDAIVVGTAERIVENNEILQELESTPSIVVGLAERIIEDNNVTHALVASDSKVVANGARELDDIEAGGTQLVTTDSIVVGSGIRTANLLQSPASEPSIVVGLAERTVEDNELNHELISSSSTVAGVAEREIVRVPDGGGPLALSPSSNDANVNYNSSDELILTGFSGHLDSYNGKYVQFPANGYVIESGNDYVVYPELFVEGASTPHNAYLKETAEEGAYYIVIWNETKQDWYVSYSTGDPRNITVGSTLPLGTLLQSLLAINSELKNSPFKTLPAQPAKVVGLSERTINLLQSPVSQESSVTGVAERTVETNEIEQQLVSGDSKTANTAKISRLPIIAAVKSGDSRLIGTGENIVVGLGPQSMESGPSKVVGAGFRTAVEEETPTQAQESTVTGVAERTVENNELNQAVISQESKTTGVAERTINGAGSLVATPSVFGTVNGEGDREIDDNEATHPLVSGDSRVGGIAERQIDAEGTLESGDSRVTCQIYQTLGFQEAIPVEQRFKIAEKPLRTILIRRPASGDPK